MVSNLKKELEISLIVLILILLFSFSFYYLVYYIFNVKFYPPTFGITFWLTIILILVIINYFLAKFILSKKNLSKKRNTIVIYSSTFASLISLFMFSELLETINYSSIKIDSINELRNSKKFEYEIKKIDALNEPKVFSRIKRETKPVRIYSEVFYTFPINPEKQKIYYCLLFKEQIDIKLSYYEEQDKLNSLIEMSKDSIANYNFQKNNKLKLITKMFRERDGFEKTFEKKSDNAIFLMPIKNPLKSEFNDTKLFFIKFMIGIFIVYIFLFFLTKVEEWK